MPLRNPQKYLYDIMGCFSLGVIPAKAGIQFFNQYCGFEHPGSPLSRGRQFCARKNSHTPVSVQEKKHNYSFDRILE